MNSKAKTVKEYLAALPAERRAVIQAVRLRIGRQDQRREMEENAEAAQVLSATA